MKKAFFLLALAFVSSSVWAQEFTAKRQVAPQPEPPRPAVEFESDSDVVKQFRNAPNKIQMVNPAAPRRYGSGAKVVVADVSDPKEKPKFIRLFSINF